MREFGVRGQVGKYHLQLPNGFIHATPAAIRKSRSGAQSVVDIGVPYVPQIFSILS